MLHEEDLSYLCFHEDEMLQKFSNDATGLEVEAHIAVSRSLIADSPPKLEEASSHWRESLRLSHEIGIRVRTIQGISELTIERVVTIQNISERVFERNADQAQLSDIEHFLNEAIDLLEEAYEVIRDDDDGDVRVALSETLSARGILLLRKSEYEAALRDCQKAHRLNRGSINTLRAFCRALIANADYKERRGHKQQAINLLRRAVKLAEEGRGLRHLAEAIKSLSNLLPGYRMEEEICPQPFLYLTQLIPSQSFLACPGLFSD